MLLHLIKKEFVVIQKQTLWMVGLIALIPLFMLWKLPQYANYLGFVFAVIYGTFIMLSYICLAEYQCKKASAYLCTTPYPRKYLPICYYFGYDKTKFVYVIIVLGLSYLLPVLIGFNIEDTISRLFMAVSPDFAGAATFITGLLIFVLSALISVRIYDHKDLA